MFDGFAKTSSPDVRRRYALTTGASVAVYGLLGLGALALAGTAAPPVMEKQVEVVFRPTPTPRAAEPPRPQAPPVAVPPTLKVKKVAGLRAPRPLVAPEKMPAARQAEADPSADHDSIEVGDDSGGGDPGGSGPPASVAPPPPPPPPPPRPRRAEPINLPENAVAPVADEGNRSPEYPEEARAKGLEGQVILKIVISETGEVTRIEVLRREEPFVAAAIAAIRPWRYSPALVDGNATAVFRIVKVPFRLRS
jgi:protein TonB